MEVIRIHIPKDRYSGEILDWCFDNFGKPMPNGVRWDSYQHTIFGLDTERFINGRMFMFYTEEAAMAFKLRWT